MAIDMRKGESVFTIKFSQAQGSIELKDYPGVGQWEAEQKWRAEFPNATLINTFRKS